MTMRRINKVGLTVLALVAVAVAIGTTLVVWSLSQGPSLADAYETCDQTGQLEDDGETLILEGYGDALTELVGDDADLEQAMNDLGLVSLDDVACVLVELDAPMSFSAELDSTRALDGTRTGGWGGFEASWTYHPDDGLNLIVTAVQ